MFSFFGDNLFDDFFDFDFPRMPALPTGSGLDRQLYGRHADRLMKTDVHEHENGYEVDIDLPGFKKEDIQLGLENGYLTVSANKGVDKSEKDAKGKVIRQERYSGSMQRSFYVGENLTEEDIKAKFADGVLSLSFPKKDQPVLPEKKVIAIEG